MPVTEYSNWYETNFNNVLRSKIMYDEMKFVLEIFWWFSNKTKIETLLKSIVLLFYHKTVVRTKKHKKTVLNNYCHDEKKNPSNYYELKKMSPIDSNDMRGATLTRQVGTLIFIRNRKFSIKFFF